MTRTPCVMSVLIIAFAFALAMAGCAGTPEGRTERNMPLTGDWVLQSIHGQSVAALLPEGGRPPSLSVAADGKVTGFGGVNRVVSSLDLSATDRGSFELSPIISTKMAGPPPAMDVETRFLSLLNQAGRFEVNNDVLSIFTEGSEPALRLVRRP